MRVGLFDSGIGGVNVLRELVKKYPHNHYIYYGDTKNLPYGNKSTEELIKLSTNIIEFLIKKKVDIIIIACGTISSNCYNELKTRYSIPIYDIISSTISYLKECPYKNIGVIATTRTIESKIFDIPNKNIIMKDTPSFVPIIENSLIDDSDQIINDELTFFNNIEALVLGCTHYPLLSNKINKYLNVPLINMGICLANKLNLTANDNLQIELYFSKLNEHIKRNTSDILEEEYTIEEVFLD